MIAWLSEWLDFIVRVYGMLAPEFSVAVVTYPIGCAVGIYWTQGLKRSQRRRRLSGREYLTSFELRGISSCISGVVICLLSQVFFEIPMDQVLVHTILGGSLAPLLVWVFLGILGAMATYFPAVASFRDSVKSGDRRKNSDGPIPETGDRRSGDDTGEFWANDSK